MHHGDLTASHTHGVQQEHSLTQEKDLKGNEKAQAPYHVTFGEGSVECQPLLRILIDFPPDPTNPFQALIDYLTKTVTPFSMLVMLGVYLSYLSTGVC